MRSRSVAQALAAAAHRLAQSRIARPRVDAEVLLANVLATSRLDLHTHRDRPLTADQESLYWELIERRAEGEPVAYLCGHKEFFSLAFYVNRSVLIPRPETEHVVEAAIEKIEAVSRDRHNPTFFDIGTGCGAIAVAVLCNVACARAIASDISTEALAVARRNAERHGVADRLRLVCGDLLEPFGSAADLVVSNPPYVAMAEGDRLAPEVRRYEPAEALFAGDDGLAVIRRLIEAAPGRLAGGGWLILELGCGQDAAVRQILLSDGRWVDVEIRCDLSGIPRVMIARKR